MILWHGDEFIKQSREEMAKRLEKAAIHLENQVKVLLSEKCTGDHSPPGGPPFLESGELRRSITHEIDRDALTARVGSNKVYARYLEMGTTKMEARPFLNNALEANKGVISQILKG